MICGVGTTLLSNLPYIAVSRQNLFLKWLRVDVIINSGILINREHSIELVKEAHLTKTFATNVIGPIMLLQTLLDIFARN